MKFFTKKSTVQKILVAIILLLLINFTITPYYSYAGWIEDGMSAIGKELFKLLAWLGDVIMSALNNFMLGADGFGSSMLDKENANLENEKSWLYVDENEVDKYEKNVITFQKSEMDNELFGKGNYEVPNMLYSPENIFANNIAALDVNFLRENKYDSIYKGGKPSFENTAEDKSKSSAVTLKNSIASWYKSFRNIAIVGLLSVLIYIGIRILISSTSADKAKYKENLRDWVVALCLVFFIHFIMSAVLMITDKCTELFDESITEGYIVNVEGGGKPFRTNLTGLVRFSAQSESFATSATYTILYIALVIYTCIFTFLYFKRFLYMAFFTMIAPLVALTYPIDKVGDGKAQAFNMWFKEYTMNVIIQPVHLILYAVFVGTAYDLAAKNPIYALVAIAFLIPAEKFIKQMFGLNKAESTGGFGSFAGGALAMKGLQKLSNVGTNGKDKGKGKSGDSSEEVDKGIFMPPSTTGELSSFGTGIKDSLNPFKENIGENQEESNIRKNNPPLEKNEDEIKQLEQQLANYDGTDPYFMDPAHQQIQMRYQELREQQQREQNRQQEEQQARSELLGPQQPIRTMQPQRRKTGEKPKPIAGYKGRMIKRGAKAVGKQVWKRKGTIARGAGAVLGGTVGLAAGLTTGDFSKTMSYMGAGALAGSSIGANAQRAVVGLGEGTVQGVKTLQQIRNEEKYGYDYAREKQREQQNQKARKAFLRDDKQKRQYTDLAAKMGYKGDVKNLMEAAADYKEAGITNEKLIQNSLQAEYLRDGSIKGRSHDKFVEVASFAHENNFSKDNITDAKKREQLDTVVDTIVPGDERAKREAALMYADIFDSRNTYEKYGKFGTTKLQKEQLEKAEKQNNANNKK